MRRRPPTLFSRQATGLAAALLLPLVCATAADEAYEPAAGIEIPLPQRDLPARNGSDGAEPPLTEPPTGGTA